MVSLTLLVWANGLWANDSITTEPQTTACANCHGANGNNKDLQGPNLAGQNHLYLIKQIIAFTNGNRIHPLLSSDDFDLNSDEAINLASYYSRLKPEASLNNLSEDSELIYSTCADCHGAQGEGISPFPRLNGQKAIYLEQQLVNFKTGVRQSTVMQAISINLTDEEIKRLAVYLGSRDTSDAMMVSKNVSIDSK
jgi:cytochrome c553